MDGAAATRLESILDSIAEGVLAVEPSGRFVYINPAARVVLDPALTDQTVAPEEQPRLYGVFRPDGVTPFPPGESPLVRALRGEATDAVDVFVRNPRIPDGRHLSVTGRPWRGPAGELLGAVIVFHDIARRAQAEAALLKAHLFLDSIIENVPTMIFVKEAKDLRFERFNRAGEELLGLSRDVLIGRNDFDIFPREQAEFFTRRDRETLAEKKLVDIPEEPIDTAQGKRWLYTKKVPILDAEGEPRYLLGISLDITARKEGEARLEQAHAELEERVRERTAQLSRANAELLQEVQERRRAEEALRRSEEQLRQSQKMEAVGRLAGGVAHDFNNMLTAILTYTDLMAQGLKPGDPHQDDLQAVREAAERAAVLTRQLLAFSRKQLLQPVVLDLGQVIRGMEGMLRRLIGEDVDLRTVAAPGLHVVRADPGQLEQVVMNLAVNARDAMPDGGKLTIEARNVELGDALLAERYPPLPPGDYVMLAVSDTGTGMPPEVKAKLFEPFFTTKPRGKGTGLGLSTVFGIVKQSGGDISVYTELGRGSTFKIYLPRAVDAAGTPTTSRTPTPGPTRAPAGLRPCTVLLVEDEDLVRNAARAVLTSRGWDVLVASSPADALELCRAHKGEIHLLLTDVVMPGMNGRELAERAAALRPGMRVLYMSGYTDNTIAHHGVLEPGVEFLDKPFTPDALARKVAEVLSRPREG